MQIFLLVDYMSSSRFCARVLFRIRIRVLDFSFRPDQNSERGLREKELVTGIYIY